MHTSPSSPYAYWQKCQRDPVTNARVVCVFVTINGVNCYYRFTERNGEMLLHSYQDEHQLENGEEWITDFPGLSTTVFRFGAAEAVEKARRAFADWDVQASNSARIAAANQRQVELAAKLAAQQEAEREDKLTRERAANSRLEQLFQGNQVVPWRELVPSTHRSELTAGKMPVNALAATLCLCDSYSRNHGIDSVQWDVWQAASGWEGQFWSKPPHEAWFFEVPNILNGLRCALRRDELGVSHVMRLLADVLAEGELDDLSLLHVVATRPSWDTYGLLPPNERLRALSSLRDTVFEVGQWLEAGDLFGYADFQQLRQEYLDFSVQLSDALHAALREQPKLNATFVAVVRAAIVEQTISPPTLLASLSDALGETWLRRLRCLPFYPGLRAYFISHDCLGAQIDSTEKHLNALTAIRSYLGEDEPSWLKTAYESTHESKIVALERDTMGDCDDEDYDDFMIEVSPGLYYDPIDDEYYGG